MTSAYSGGCVGGRLYGVKDANDRPIRRKNLFRLGARQEGIVRHQRIMPDGRKRNSVRCSIIDDEWPLVRRNLGQKLADFR